MRRSSLWASLWGVALFTSIATAQAAKDSSCTISPINTNRQLPNMFSAAQEADLGEVLDQVVQDNVYQIDEPDLAVYLQHLGDRLASNLPPLGLKFRFYLSNAPEANAFSIAGGKVYVTRKLIGFVHSEDELAGVLAHELGHIVTHQSAVDYTRYFKAIGIHEVGDQADIESKFHRLLESGKRFRVSEDERQMEADRVGLELLSLAGYKTDAPADFFDRLSNNKGKTGNWFTELFGTTSESAKRLREMQKTIRHFPAECVQRVAQGSAKFTEWQCKVVAYSGTGRQENVPGLLSKTPLDPPLQDEVHTLRFSYDGNYLLAQDGGSIYVLTREPLAFKFRIEAPDAYPARFTWDSRRITFYNPDLHVEVWDVDSATRVDAYEVVSPFGCLQTALAPDGRTLACVDFKETLGLFDTATEERIFEKKDIRKAEIGFNAGVSGWQFSYEIRFLNMGFSLDSRYFVVASANVVLALDVTTRREIPVSGVLKPYLQGAFSFIGDRTLVGNERNGSRAAILGFPEGPVLHQIDLGSSAPFPVAKGDCVLMRPIRDYAVGVLDVRSNSIVRASKTPALDLYGDNAASMLASGEVGLFGGSTTPVAKLVLPRGHFGGLQAAEFSDDLNWLAVCTRARGSVWNLANGSRPYSVKGFKAACFAKDGDLYVDFPKQEKIDRSIVRANLRQNGMTLVKKIEPGKAWQACEYLLSLKRKDADSARKDKDARENTENKDDQDRDDEVERDYRFEGKRVSWRDVFQYSDSDRVLEVHDVRTGTLLWSKPFNKAIPAIYTNAFANVAAFRWPMWTDGARAELARLPHVWKPAGVHDADYLVEVVDLASGKFINAIVVGTASGAFQIQKHMATGEWVVIYDSLRRTQIYSLKTGQCVGKFFAKPRGLSPTGTVLAEHGPGRLVLYEASSAAKTRDLVLPFTVSTSFFSRDGSKLLLLTNDQILYTIDPALPRNDNPNSAARAIQ